MLAACYAYALAAALSPAVEDLVTRIRAALLCGLSAGLGAVATGGLRLVDSRSALAGALGCAVLLGVGIALDLAEVARGRVSEEDVRAMRDEMHTLTEGLHVRLDEVLVKVVGYGRQSFTDRSAAERTGSLPAIEVPPSRKSRP